MCNTPFCSCKMKRASANRFVSRQPNDFFELAENSVGRSHLGVNNEDSPTLAGGGGENRQSRSRDGVFNRLRRTLSISRRSPQSLSAVVPFKNGSEEEVEENSHISVVQKTRGPHYRCVPLPPGFIPSELLMSLDHQDQSGQTAETRNAVATIKFEQVGNQSPTTAAKDGVNSATNISSGQHKVKRGIPRRVLYNNWVDPKF